MKQSLERISIRLQYIKLLKIQQTDIISNIKVVSSQFNHFQAYESFQKSFLNSSLFFFFSWLQWFPII